VTVQTPTTVDLRKYIDTHFFGERPHVRGRRVPVATIAYSSRSQGWDVTELAYQFTLSTAQVLSALLYYEEHQAEIDAQEAEEAALFDEEYRKHHGKD
jgi:uncharacterized protein (DUF433 family)